MGKGFYERDWGVLMSEPSGLKKRLGIVKLRLAPRTALLLIESE